MCSSDLDATAPAAMWEEKLAPSATVSWPKDAEVDVLGLVLEGDAVVTGAGPGDAKLEVDGWQAFRAAGAGVTVRAGTSGARVVVVAATSGEPLATALAKLDKEGRKVGWAKRAAKLTRVDLTQPYRGKYFSKICTFYVLPYYLIL